MAGTTAIQVTETIPLKDLPGRHLMAYRDMIEAKRVLADEEGARYVALAQDEAPKRSGEFATALTHETFTTPNGAGFRMAMPTPIGTWIVEGTPAHVIRAHGRALAFDWPGGPRGGGTHFYVSVNHPGTRPNDFRRRAYQRWEPGARQRLRFVGTVYVQSFVGGS